MKNLESIFNTHHSLTDLIKTPDSDAMRLSFCGGSYYSCLYVTLSNVKGQACGLPFQANSRASVVNVPTALAL